MRGMLDKEKYSNFGGLHKMRKNYTVDKLWISGEVRKVGSNPLKLLPFLSILLQS